MMLIHLFSSAGEPPLQNVLDVGLPILANRSDPAVLYIPPTFIPEYMELTRQKFINLAEILPVDLAAVDHNDFPRSLEQASMIFIPGGNTYLLNHRLHRTSIGKAIVDKVKAGVPYIGMSAGCLVCGANILTTNDINCCGTAHFNGFGFVSNNFLAHYPSEDGPERERIDDRVAAYHQFFDNPVLALEDGAHLLISDSGVELQSGNCWMFRKNQVKKRFQP